MDSSYLSQQITTIVTQLHGLFDDIGVPSHERESRESDVWSHSLLQVLRLTILSVVLCVVGNAS